MALERDNGEELRAKAAAMIPEILAGREAKLAEFVRLHETDKRSFAFACKRHGQFLAVFVSRGPAQREYYQTFRDGHPNKSAHAINLLGVQVISLGRGHEPDMLGRAAFHDPYYSGEGIIRVDYEYSYYPRYPELAFDAAAQQGAMFIGGGGRSALSNTHVAECPRGAQDDEVYFKGLGLRLKVPAGLGQSVFDAILLESEQAVGTGVG